MDVDFWEARWAKNEIGFHRSEVNPLLIRHWPNASISAGATVLAPLCGKSVDLWWLAEQGYQVIGVELAETAVRDFFTEAGVTPRCQQLDGLVVYQHAQVTILQGDFFAVTIALLTKGSLPIPTALYDRAALIALPQEMRQRYAKHLATLLPPQFPGLLETLDYPHPQRRSPPFPVTDAEVQSLYEPITMISKVYQEDLIGKEPRFKPGNFEWAHQNIYQLGALTDA